MTLQQLQDIISFHDKHIKTKGIVLYLTKKEIDEITEGLDVAFGLYNSPVIKGVTFMNHCGYELQIVHLDEISELLKK